MAEPPDEAFVVELTSSQRRLYAYVFTLLGDREQTQDVVQETNIVLWRRAHEFTPGTNFIAFAFRTAYFQVLSYRQRLGREKLLFDEELLGDLSESVQSDVDDEDRQRILEKCMEKLPENHRELLRLRYLESSSVESIAKQVSRSVGSVAMVLHRIRTALIKCVERSMAAEGQ